MPNKKEAKGELIPAALSITDKSVFSDPKLIKRELNRQLDVRKVYTRIIKEYLVDGVDYAPIHISKSCQYKYTPEKCNEPSHWSKPNLKKSGCEKIMGLFTLRAEFHKDEETQSMLPNEKNTVFYICRLIHIGSGEIVTEGRGACSTEEKNGNINNTVKIAQKRAKMDAVLSLGFSDSFTCDLEDMEEPEDNHHTVVVSGPVVNAEVVPAGTNQTKTASEVSMEDRKATFFASLRTRLDKFPPEERTKQKASVIGNILKTHKEFTQEELEKSL